MLKILLQPLPEWVGDLVETDELPNSQHLSVVTCGARVQPLDDGGHISKYASIHQRCDENKTQTFSLRALR